MGQCAPMGMSDPYQSGRDSLNEVEKAILEACQMVTSTMYDQHPSGRSGRNEEKPPVENIHIGVDDILLHRRTYNNNNNPLPPQDTKSDPREKFNGNGKFADKIASVEKKIQRPDHRNMLNRSIVKKDDMSVVSELTSLTLNTTRRDVTIISDKKNKRKNNIMNANRTYLPKGHDRQGNFSIKENLNSSELLDVSPRKNNSRKSMNMTYSAAEEASSFGGSITDSRMDEYTLRFDAEEMANRDSSDDILACKALPRNKNDVNVVKVFSTQTRKGEARKSSSESSVKKKNNKLNHIVENPSENNDCATIDESCPSVNLLEDVQESTSNESEGEGDHEIKNSLSPPDTETVYSEASTQEESNRITELESNQSSRENDDDESNQELKDDEDEETPKSPISHVVETRSQLLEHESVSLATKENPEIRVETVTTAASNSTSPPPPPPPASTKSVGAMSKSSISSLSKNSKRRTPTKKSSTKSITLSPTASIHLQRSEHSVVSHGSSTDNNSNSKQITPESDYVENTSVTKTEPENTELSTKLEPSPQVALPASAEDQVVSNVVEKDRFTFENVSSNSSSEDVQSHSIPQKAHDPISYISTSKASTTPISAISTSFTNLHELNDYSSQAVNSAKNSAMNYNHHQTQIEDTTVNSYKPENSHIIHNAILSPIHPHPTTTEGVKKPMNETYNINTSALNEFSKADESLRKIQNLCDEALLMPMTENNVQKKSSVSPVKNMRISIESKPKPDVLLDESITSTLNKKIDSNSFIQSLHLDNNNIKNSGGGGESNVLRDNYTTSVTPQSTTSSFITSEFMKESSVITAASAMNISEHAHGKPPVSPTKSLERSPTKRMHSNFFNKDSSTIVSYNSINNSQYEKGFDLKGSSGDKTMDNFLSSSLNSERNVTSCMPPTDAFQSNNNIVSTSESNFPSRTTLDQEFKYNLPYDISKNEPYRVNDSEGSTRAMPLKVEEQPNFSYNNTKSSLTDMPLPISRFDPTKEEGDLLMYESNRGLDPLEKDDLLVPPDFTTMSSTLRVVPRNNNNNDNESFHHSSSDLALNTTTGPISFAPPDKKNLLNDDDDQSYIDHSQPTPPIDLNLLGKQRVDDLLPQNSREPQEQKKNYQVDDLTISYTKLSSQQQGVVSPSDDFLENQKVVSKTPPLDPRMFGNDSVNISGSISNNMTYERSEGRSSTMGMSTMTPSSAPQETTHEVKYGTYNYKNHGISTDNKESSRSLHQTSDHHNHTDTVVNHSETSRYGENETWRSPDRHLLRPINETCYSYGVKPGGDSLSDHGGRRMSAEYNNNIEESYSHRSENTYSNNSIPQSGFMMRDEYNNTRDQVSPRSWNGSMSRQTFRSQYSDHLHAGFDERSTTSSLNGSMRRRMTPSQTSSGGGGAQDTISNSGSSVSARNYYNPVPSPASSRHTAGRSRTMCDLLIEGDIDGMSGISTPERRHDTSFGVPKSYHTKKLLSDVQMKLNELEESSEAGKSSQKRNNNNVDGDRGKISRSSSFSSTGSSLIDRCQGILDGRSNTPIGKVLTSFFTIFLCIIICCFISKSNIFYV